MKVPFDLCTPLVFRTLEYMLRAAYYCRAVAMRGFLGICFAGGWVVIENDCYDSRRLPVIREVASKLARPLASRVIRNSFLALVVDMLVPAVVMSLAKSKPARR